MRWNAFRWQYHNRRSQGGSNRFCWMSHAIYPKRGWCYFWHMKISLRRRQQLEWKTSLLVLFNGLQLIFKHNFIELAHGSFWFIITTATTTTVDHHTHETYDEVKKLKNYIYTPWLFGGRENCLTSKIDWNYDGFSMVFDVSLFTV